MNSYLLGARLAQAPLRSYRVGAYVGVMFTLLSTVSMLERGRSPAASFDHVLFRFVLTWALPLTSFFAVSDVCYKSRLGQGFNPIGRYGHSKRELTLGSLCTAGAFSVAVNLLFVWVALGLTQQSFNRTVLVDGLTTSWVVSLGALTYVVWFAFWSTLGEHGGGRIFGLLLDWGLGLGGSLASWFSPQAHLRNLLGGPAPGGLLQSYSTISLAGILVLCLALALRRTDP